MKKKRKLAGAGAQIHHIGIEVTDRPSMIKKIEDNGGTIFSDPRRRRSENTILRMAPWGKSSGVGRYPKKDKKPEKGRIAPRLP